MAAAGVVVREGQEDVLQQCSNAAAILTGHLPLTRETYLSCHPFLLHDILY